jgi:hypothetical protein
MDKVVAKGRATAALRHPLAHAGENKRRLVEAAASQIRTMTVAKSTDGQCSLVHINDDACSDKRQDLRCGRLLIVSRLDWTPSDLIARQPHSKASSPFRDKTQDKNWVVCQCDGYSQAYGPLQ